MLSLRALANWVHRNDWKPSDFSRSRYLPSDIKGHYGGHNPEPQELSVCVTISGPQPSGFIELHWVNATTRPGVSLLSILDYQQPVEFRMGDVLARTWTILSRHFLTFLFLVGIAQLLPLLLKV